ncbi:hypothetical protein PIB30_089845 [Stylosanthes scabra]|uniref:Uncharacterized protein n=1 Tax=Stylosanthes scabra TaxID=79078 RepID=A0ABU6UTJ0_9FABA|nr:hypothetical protein [Stylosanthes scabra]
MGAISYSGGQHDCASCHLRASPLVALDCSGSPDILPYHRVASGGPSYSTVRRGAGHPWGTLTLTSFTAWMREGVIDGSPARPRLGTVIGILEEHVMIIERFLSGDAAHMNSRMTDVPVEASQRVPTQVPPRSQVSDVLDNRRIERRMRAMEEGQDPDVSTKRIHRMPESAIGARRRRGCRGRSARLDGVDAGGGDQAGPFHTEVGASGHQLGEASGSAVPQTPGASTHGYVDETQPNFGSPGASFFDGILSPTSMEQQFGQEPSYYANLAQCLQESSHPIIRPGSVAPPGGPQ